MRQLTNAWEEDGGWENNKDHASDFYKKHYKQHQPKTYMELTLFFILSQICMFFASILDFLSFQFKKRKYMFTCFVFSAALISAHYFLLGKIAAGVIVCFSVARFILTYFTTNKKYLIMFIALNTISLFFTYSEIYDLIVYTGITIFIIGNFQKNNQRMRKIMMMGTSFIVLYNIIILSPMGIIAESIFLSSNFIGYYRHYIKKKKTKKDELLIKE